MLNIIGGTYIEYCREPLSREVFGSGFRAAIALADKTIELKFNSCVGKDDFDTVSSLCNTYGIHSDLIELDNTISFHYDHPLTPPQILIGEKDIISLSVGHSDQDNMLYYGMAEATAAINGNYVVFDPQNRVSFKDTNSTANHLAIILNKQEAQYFYGHDEEDIMLLGQKLIELENAEVVVIKNGSHGAFVIESGSFEAIPVFKTERIWPIGSGDIFTAVFAWKWIESRMTAKEAAYFASNYTAYYCETRDLPLPENIARYSPLETSSEKKRIYLAGPFFTMGDRWLINEFRKALLRFDNLVFSPYHDVGLGLSQSVVDKDIAAISNSDVVLAIVNGLDPGTLFEIGYARAMGKRVVIMAESTADGDLLMLKGTGCEITDDFSTAVYKASW